MADEIDFLMDLDPLALAGTDGGIDAIVQHMRNRRAMAEAGVKVKKETGPALKLDLSALGLKKPTEPIKRRV